MENVYLVRAGGISVKHNTEHKIRVLLESAGLENHVAKDELTAVKVHFGELGKDAFVPALSVSSIIDAIKQPGAKPFLTDTNTLSSKEDETQLTTQRPRQNMGLPGQQLTVQLSLLTD